MKNVNINIGHTGDEETDESIIATVIVLAVSVGLYVLARAILNQSL